MPFTIRRYSFAFTVVILSLLAIWLFYPMTIQIMAQMVGQPPLSPRPAVKFWTVLSIAFGITLCVLPGCCLAERKVDRWFLAFMGIVVGGFLPFLMILGIGLAPELFHG